MKIIKRLLHICSKLIVTFSLIAQFSLAEESIPLQFMSIDELRVCAKEDARLKERTASIEKTRKQLEGELPALSNEAGTLASVLEALSKKQTQAEMDAYNARVDDHNRRIEDHRKRAQAFDLEIDEHNKATAASMKACATRPFLLRDQETVMKELEQK
jgi:septal ring factor EnvC (AmiA/AmiB activator)